MNSYYNQANFLLSASRLSGLPEDSGYEVAFAGRSNAGKSSAINTLCRRRGLARASKTPGRTQLINFFSLDEERRLVDLPGYGYAKVPEEIRRKWGKLMRDYLGKRECLKGLVLIMDIRHPLTEGDWQMLHWAQEHALAIHILLTKADKLKRGPALTTAHQVAAALGDADIEATVQPFSSLKAEGIEDLHSILDAWLGWT
ncbi:cell division checkpoint GTPase YihA [Ectothiorhodosinus mongolicus]|uniref:Probable GTP-binding protein EngB n=1 Tax=Ectothiorhodosinus mongolicus TaxID=233100 RepID=A0A1R3VVV1_9GAMM|nr:ribosome biogenesis GTP-binding protein YihA/YsxC [Ectothiorhodosinus mongolicus]ULX56958.1 YihA family ribosome biogenesis GTP-binding protein [Ectothiorhodosinus mongolicus]SIT69178.1 cell division checkpoint GTPase YihA [Ectothiorhodosinus mongolicus]